MLTFGAIMKRRQFYGLNKVGKSGVRILLEIVLLQGFQLAFLPARPRCRIKDSNLSRATTTTYKITLVGNYNIFTNLFLFCCLSSLLHSHAHYLELTLIISLDVVNNYEATLVMGCDGGTIPRRDELVKLKKKAEKVRKSRVSNIAVV